MHPNEDVDDEVVAGKTLPKWVPTYSKGIIEAMILPIMTKYC